MEPLVTALGPLLNSSVAMNFANAMFANLLSGQPGGLNITAMLG